MGKMIHFERQFTSVASITKNKGRVSQKFVLPLDRSPCTRGDGVVF